jgi:spore coat polysaccharide biosynthesis protein SpsF (cytidylyltransferase family)
MADGPYRGGGGEVKAVAVLTARYWSSRLPGKILKEVAGKPAIEHCLSRLKKIGIPVVIACPKDERKTFTGYAKQFKASIYGGADDSPLHRLAGYLRAHPEYTHLVRVTADDILIDPETVKGMLALAKSDPDLGYINCPSIAEGAGVEVMHRDNVLAAARIYGPTEYVSYFVRGAKMPKPKDAQYKPRLTVARPYRLTMDYPADWQLIHAVLSTLGPDATCDDICRHIDHHPELLNINRLPTLSVYTGVLNGEKTIGRTIASVLSSIGDNAEYIIIDDGSRDGTLAEIAKFMCDPRIKLVINEKNKGLATSSNIAIGMAKGRYIMRVDADDMLLRENFMTSFWGMAKALDAGAVVVYPAYFQVGDVFSTEIKEGHEHHHAGCALMLKSAINEIRFRDGLRNWDGLELYKRLAMREDAIVYNSTPTWYYRVSKNSMSRTNTKERAELFISLGLDGIGTWKGYGKS